MDKGIVFLVETLNDMGYETIGSCQGGGSGKWGEKGHDKESYISFVKKLDSKEREEVRGLLRDLGISGMYFDEEGRTEDYGVLFPHSVVRFPV